MQDDPHRLTHSTADWPSRCVLFLKGMAMGLADAVPGVSGGTIAVISGIYEELIHSIKSINPLNLPVLWQQGFLPFWKLINGNFLLLLLLGILSSLILAANTVLYLLEFYFTLVMAFFIGLILASTYFLHKQIQQWSVVNGLCLMLGVGVTVLAVFANPVTTDLSLGYIFICGVIAICAMILPGLSGAYILILLGAYNQMLDALSSLQLDMIFVFVSGCVLGLLSFSHILALAFFYYRQQAYAFLTGMLATSVIALWPWQTQQTVDTAGQFIPRINLSPLRFEEVTGQNPQIIQVLLLLVAGFTLITAFEYYARGKEE